MRKETKERFFKAAKIGIVTLFALMTVVGSTLTLTACTAKHNTNNNGINPMPGPGYETPIDNSQNQEIKPNENNNNEQINPGENNGQVKPGENGEQEVKPGENNQEENPNEQNPEVKPGEENNGEVNPGEEQKPTEPEVDLEALKQQQLAQLEESIETGLVQKLNDKFGEELVEYIDVNYFTLEQDVNLNTTIFANGAIKFVNDETLHTLSLGLSVDSDAFLKISPLYYVEADYSKDISENYSVDDLTAYNEFISDDELQFSTAKLDGENWNFNTLTAAQIEKQLEQDCEAKARQFFKDEFNSEYVKDVDFKYITTEHDLSYGYMLELCGKTANIHNDKIKDICLKIKITKEDFDYLNSEVLTEMVNADNDLKDNYTVEQLNKVITIMKSDTSYVRFCKLDEMDYGVDSGYFVFEK